MQRPAILIDAHIHLHISFVDFSETRGSAAEAVIFVSFAVLLVSIFASILTQFFDLFLILLSEVSVF